MIGAAMSREEVDALTTLMDKQIALEIFQTVVVLLIAVTLLIDLFWPGKGNEEEEDA